MLEWNNSEQKLLQKNVDDDKIWVTTCQPNGSSPVFSFQNWSEHIGRVIPFLEFSAFIYFLLGPPG